MTTSEKLSLGYILRTNLPKEEMTYLKQVEIHPTPSYDITGTEPVPMAYTFQRQPFSEFLRIQYPRCRIAFETYFKSQPRERTRPLHEVAGMVARMFQLDYDSADLITDTLREWESILQSDLPLRAYIGTEVLDSPIGAGTITGLSQRGYPQVNEVTCVWAQLLDKSYIPQEPV